MPLQHQGSTYCGRLRDCRSITAPICRLTSCTPAIGAYEGLIVRSRTKVTAEVLANASRLRVIGRAGIGVDNIDVATATTAGVVVMNTPEGNTNTAAEHTIAMLLALARNIAPADGAMKRGEWERDRFVGVEVVGKILGVIGLGRVGALVAKKAQGLGIITLAYDPFVSRERAQSMGVELLELSELLPRVDFITVHTPKTRGTTHLIGRDEFALMKRGVRVVNCARGGIIDEAALYEAIQSGTVTGAALDVFEQRTSGRGRAAPRPPSRRALHPASRSLDGGSSRARRRRYRPADDRLPTIWLHSQRGECLSPRRRDVAQN